MPSFTRTSPLPLLPPGDLSSLPTPDLLLFCPGSSSPPLPAHRLVLASSSSFLHSLLPPTPSCCPPTLILPEVSPHLLPPLLHLLYTGQTSLLAQQDKDSFLDLARSLGLPTLWRGKLDSWPDTASESSEYLSAGDQTTNSLLGHEETITDDTDVQGSSETIKIPGDNLVRMIDSKDVMTSSSTKDNPSKSIDSIVDEQIVNTLANLSLQTKVNISNTFCRPDLFSSESESEEVVVKAGNNRDVDKEENELSELSLTVNGVNMILENEVESYQCNNEVEASNVKETSDETNSPALSSVSHIRKKYNGTEDTTGNIEDNTTEASETLKDSLDTIAKIKKCFVRVEKSVKDNYEQQIRKEELVDVSEQVDMSKEAEEFCDDSSEECSEVSDQSEDDNIDDEVESESSDDNYEPELSKNNLSDSDCSDGGAVPCTCRGSCVRNCSCRTAGSRCTPSCSCLPQNCRLQTPASWQIPAPESDQEAQGSPLRSSASSDLLESENEVHSAPSDLLVVPDKKSPGPPPAPLESDSNIPLSAVKCSRHNVLTPIMEKNTTITSISTSKKKKKKLFTETLVPQEFEEL